MNDLIPKMLEFAAIEAVAVATVRRLPPGVLGLIRSHLAHIDTRSIPIEGGLFREWLDRETERILDRICDTAKCRPWGTARKALNMFLRDCSYHHFLRAEYNLARIEEFLEIPLDGRVTEALRGDAGRGKLPQWPGVAKLTPRISDRYQEHASMLARQRGLPHRVHLDICLWLDNRPDQ